MTQYTALIICALFITWLFARDRKLRPMTSLSLWIPFTWIFIIGSRPITHWFGVEAGADSAESYMEGTPLDRNVFLLLLLAGAIALWRRSPDWGKILGANRWLFLFFLYCGASVMWSDYPFVSMKRWIKDLGNIVMILILLTEKDPVATIKAVFARYIYLAIPLSVLLILFFPDLGIDYDRWSKEAAFCGIAINKNSLGIILVISGLFLIWDLIEKQGAPGAKRSTADMLVRMVLLGMVAWLLMVARSSTALLCLPVGVGLLVVFRLPLLKRRASRIGVYTLAAAAAVLGVFFAPAIVELIVGTVGRDMTFTGRTDIWTSLLREPVNPVFGAGFDSFWLRPGMMESYNNINQAHNGYVETFLNGGLAGLGLLLALLLATGLKLRRELLADGFGIVRFSLFMVAIFYNLSEAMFNSLGLIWFALLIASVSYESRPEAVAEQATDQRTFRWRKPAYGQVFRP